LISFTTPIFIALPPRLIVGVFLASERCAMISIKGGDMESQATRCSFKGPTVSRNPVLLDNARLSAVMSRQPAQRGQLTLARRRRPILMWLNDVFAHPHTPSTKR
jgi:hypothetical protein